MKAQASFHYQLRLHVVVVNAADGAALHRVFALSRRFEGNNRGLARINRGVDAKIGNVQAVLYVHGGDFKLDVVTTLNPDYRRLNLILLHYHLDVLGRRLPGTAGQQQEK